VARRIHPWASHATVALLAAALGAFTFRPSAPADHPLDTTRHAVPPASALASAPDAMAVMQAQAPLVASPQAVSAPPARVGLDAVKTLVRRLSQQARSPTPGPLGEREREAVQAQLLGELAQNPQALAWAIEQFRNSLGSPEGAQLGAMLGTFNDPEIVQLARELQTSGSRNAQLAGLELAARLQVGDAGLRAQALNLLGQSSNDRDIAAAALYALKREPTAPAEQTAIVDGLLKSVGHADAEVRRRSAIALADWAQDGPSLTPVVRALNDVSVDVRAGAAFALGRSRFVAPQAEQQLVARVSDEREDWTVRDLAWRALNQYPLSESGYAAYQRFASLRAGVTERRNGGEITAH
jgi:HEAT repeats